MINCRGARAADGSWGFINGILSFYRGRDVKLGSIFSVCIYRMIIVAFKFEAFWDENGNFENYSSFHENRSAFWRLGLEQF